MELLSFMRTLKTFKKRPHNKKHEVHFIVDGENDLSFELLLNFMFPTQTPRTFEVFVQVYSHLRGNN
ncbi:hypothetical protein D3C76_577490 [compost metagenome]